VPTDRGTMPCWSPTLPAATQVAQAIVQATKNQDADAASKAIQLQKETDLDSPVWNGWNYVPA